MDDFYCSLAVKRSISDSTNKGDHVVVLVDFKQQEVLAVLSFERKEEFKIKQEHLDVLSQMGIKVGNQKNKKKTSLALIGDNVEPLIRKRENA